MANQDQNLVHREIIPYLSPYIGNLMSKQKETLFSQLEEIRLRCHQPLLLKIGEEDYSIDHKGLISKDIKNGYKVSEDDIFRTMASISDNSIYAFQEDIKKGFLTLPGGHRVGLSGQVLVHDHQVQTIKNFSGICIRIAREVHNASHPILRYICPASQHRAINTLIMSPPRAGKTTILRDLARIISNGHQGIPPHNVVIVDERSELAGCYEGIPQLDVGLRTDVLDGCPKALGMQMALRSLAPQVIITDEIGREEDFSAIRDCINAGVTVISSIHAGSFQELQRRPDMRDLLATGVFKVGILLGRDFGPGTIKEIVRWDEAC
ncbi:stage III sporulation protein AA [Syntrophomonas palmitatica]|uniref:stage III sporulation protein AA n=1 Tax=Syntrophomonas palmitatica TaxID=402877 RepID=UPI0006D2B612|nr:stage III sporulation protein AA [Syntrophomonas palmitatica]